MDIRKEIYGKRKEFILSHYEDIISLRKRKSAREVAAMFGGMISLWDIYKIEKIFK